MRISRQWRSLKGIAIGLGIGLVLLTSTSTSSYAIPFAGNYEWDPGQSISGTFTSNGSSLTQWDMTLGGVFTTGPTTNNSPTLFEQAIGTSLLTIHWFPSSDNAADFAEYRINGTGIRFSDLPTFSKINAVPEPTASLQLALGLGLLACAGYRVRQRRQAGLQVG